MNSEEDSRYLVYSGDIDEQVKREPNGLFDCPRKVSKILAQDIGASLAPFEELGVDIPRKRWSDVPLFTNMCLNKIVSVVRGLEFAGLLTPPLSQACNDPSQRQQGCKAVLLAIDLDAIELSQSHGKTVIYERSQVPRTASWRRL